MITAAYAHSTLIRSPQRRFSRRRNAFMQVIDLERGAGERIRTADLPFTRRLLCQLSYTGWRLGAW
jgi:hypothetical protein